MRFPTSKLIIKSLSLMILTGLSTSLVWAQEEEEKTLAANVFVALDGDDNNPGILSKPKATIEGALKIVREFRSQGLIEPGLPINIWVRGGRYPINQSVYLGVDESGTKEAPFRISAYKDEKVVFDGRKIIPKELFRTLKDETELKRLPKSAHGHVVVADIPQGELSSGLSNRRTQISFGNRMLQIARFPNNGFAFVNKTISSDTPKGKGTADDPKGATIHLSPSPKMDWSSEIGRDDKLRMIGYLGAAWLKETFRIHSVSSSGNITLMDGTAYGFPRPGKIGRVYVENIISELDEPGEWYYDSSSRRIYVWPPSGLDSNADIGIWAGRTAFHLGGCNYASIERITIENLGGGSNGDGAVNITGGVGNVIAGCTFRNIASPATAVNISGSSNGVLSCDFYDIENASRLNGGRASSKEIVPGKNYIENCHFTQIYSKSFYGKVSGIGGAGNIFRNNLVHNHNGQIVTMSGPDHLVELNEVFNTGVEEGDGGAFYQGAQFTSWGNTFKNNFFHHIICIPQLYTRAAIFSDDGDMGDRVIGNVFYKAGEGFKMNAGSGHYARDNVAIENIHIFQVLRGRPKSSYKKTMDYIDNNINQLDKGNYFGKAMPIFGTDGWRDTLNSGNWINHVSPYWLDRYPRMNEVFTAWNKKKECTSLNTFENNFLFDTSIAAPETNTLKKNENGKSLRSFVDAKNMNFAWRSPKPRWAPDIPFEKIGLYVDKFRPNPPNKEGYRAEIAKHWKDTRSAAPREYKVKLVNERSYYNTGLVVKKHTPAAKKAKKKSSKN